MPLQNVSYGTLINSISTYITNNCANLNNDRYNALPASIRGGRAISRDYSSGNEYHAHIYLDTTGIANLTGRNITNDIKTYKVDGNTQLQTIYPDGENISIPKFISFFNNIVSYCVGSMEFVTGGVNGVDNSGANVIGNPYLVYKSTIDNTYKYKAEPDSIIYAKSVNEVIDVLRTVLNRNIRSRIVPFSWSGD